MAAERALRYNWRVPYRETRQSIERAIAAQKRERSARGPDPERMMAALERHLAQLRETLEPIFIKYGVDLVLTGHEHFYERIKPQHGIYHFIMGSSSKLRAGNIATSALTAKGYDRDRAFMLMELTPTQLSFQTISRTGAAIDSGVLARAGEEPAW